MSFLDILHEIANDNPSINPQDLSSIVVDYIETVLPDVIKSVSVPLTPTPFALRRREFKLERMPKAGKSVVERHDEEVEQFSREIALLRKRLDGTASSNMLNRIPDLDWNSPFPPTWPLPHRTDIVQSEKTHPEFATTPPVDLPRRIRSPSPYIAGVKEGAETPKLKFRLDQITEDRLLEDRILIDFMRVVELTIRKFVQNYKLRWDFDVLSPEDPEMPWWRKTVLHITPSRMSFDELMQLWDRIDDQVRQATKLIEEQLPPDEISQLREINKNFFIDMELS